MMALKIVLCPVDFSSATSRQIDVAADLCQAFGAKLVVHHNRHALGSGPGVGWMWSADHHSDTQASLEKKLQDCVACASEGLTTETLLTEGPRARSVLAAGEAVNADLVVLTAHGRHAEDHASITELLLEEGRRAVLVLHERSIEPRTPHFAAGTAERQVVVAPTDLTSKSSAALAVAFDLARTLSIELHLLHLLPKRASFRRPDSTAEALAQLRGLIPEDLQGRVEAHVEYGDPSNGIAGFAEQIGAACIVMGEHTRTPLRRLFRPGISRAVLHHAHCPVWYVPGSGAAVSDQASASGKAAVEELMTKE
jgi:nucleotide-binding universal stress UspA family protein